MAIVTLVGGVGPDGQPFAAGATLDVRYTSIHAAWVVGLIQTGGAIEVTDNPPVQEAGPSAVAGPLDGLARVRGQHGWPLYTPVAGSAPVAPAPLPTAAPAVQQHATPVVHEASAALERDYEIDQGDN